MLGDLLNLAVVAFAVTSMFAVGTTYTARQILGPLRRARLVVLGLLANFLLVPAWAVLVTWLLQLDEPFRVGILLVAAAAGAPILVRLVATADGDVAFASSLLVLLVPATVLYMPLAVPLIAPDAEISALAIATPLTTTILLPLAAGMIALATLPALAARLRPALGAVSTVALVAMLVFTVAANTDGLLDVIGERAILATLALLAGAFAIGFALGAPDRHKGEIALTTAQRNIAAATVVATQAIGDPDTIVTVVLTSTVSIVVLFPLAARMKGRSGAVATGAPGMGAG